MAVADQVSLELEAKIASYMSDVKRAADRFEADLGRIERSAGNVERTTQTAFTNIARSAKLLAGAFTAREVLQYADAWTKAKNSLATAGITGTQQAAVLEQLYQAAQKNYAPLDALTTLYGKVAQAQTMLGASQNDLLKFTDGVATALRVAGTDANAARGALLQLSQGLGSGTVRAEEFNSVLEGARPIITAVANNIEEAGGSISKLKTLVDEGKISSRQFFEAFNRGIPALQAQAANASLTVAQAVTKINNAFTRYIGQTDEGLGATQRLAQGLGALADNFNTVGDMVIKVAAIIAAALIGRAIVPMVASLGLGVAALTRFSIAMGQAAVVAQGTAATLRGFAGAFAGLATAAGPVGLVIGTVVGGALAYFLSQSTAAAQGANTYAEALRRVEEAAKPAGAAVNDMGRRITESQKAALIAGIEEGTKKLGELRLEFDNFFNRVTQGWESAFVSPKAIEAIKALVAQFASGKKTAEEVRQEFSRLGNEDASVRQISNEFARMLNLIQQGRTAIENLSADLRAAGQAAVGLGQALARPSGTINWNMGFGDSVGQQQTIQNLERRNRLSTEALRLEDKIAELRRDGSLYGLDDRRLRELAQGVIAAEDRRSEEDKTRRRSTRATASDRFGQDIQATRDRTEALRLETELVGKSYEESERRKLALQLEQEALRDLREEARRKGETDFTNIRLSQEQRDRINEVSAAYASQADQLRKVQEANERAKQSASEFYDAFKSNMIGAITGAKSLTEALSNVLKKLSDILLNSAFDMLFKGSGGNNIFSGLFNGSWFSGSGGGGLGQALNIFPEMAKGGRVAAGQPYIVGEHRPEIFVPDSNGAIIPSIPKFNSMAGGNSAGGSFTFAPVIDARGADVAAVARLEMVVGEMQRSFGAQAVQAVKSGNSKRLFGRT